MDKGFVVLAQILAMRTTTVFAQPPRPIGADCYRRMDIVLDKCDNSTGFTMHILDRATNSWVIHLKHLLCCFLCPATLLLIDH